MKLPGVVELPPHPNPLPRSGGEGDKTSQATTALCLVPHLCSQAGHVHEEVRRAAGERITQVVLLLGTADVRPVDAGVARRSA